MSSDHKLIYLLQGYIEKLNQVNFDPILVVSQIGVHIGIGRIQTSFRSPRDDSHQLGSTILCVSVRNRTTRVALKKSLFESMDSSQFCLNIYIATTSGRTIHTEHALTDHVRCPHLLALATVDHSLRCFQHQVSNWLVVVQFAPSAYDGFRSNWKA